MKTIVVFLVLIILIGFGAIITKPTDEQCIEIAKGKINSEIYKSSSNNFVKGIESLFVDIGVNKVLFRIEDKIFYKDIFLKIDNSNVGVGVFGTVIINDRGSNRASISSNRSNENNAADNANNPPAMVSRFYSDTSAPPPAPAPDTIAINNDNSTDLENAKAKLVAAKDRLVQIKKFHFLRTDKEREQQIYQQTIKINNIQKRIKELENRVQF